MHWMQYRITSNHIYYVISWFDSNYEYISFSSVQNYSTDLQYWDHRDLYPLNDFTYLSNIDIARSWMMLSFVLNALKVT